jgi:alpha-galactosidase
MPIYDSGGGWVLETARTAYALGIDERGQLVHRYWGPRLPFADDYPPPSSPREWAAFDSPAHLARTEYPAYGGTSYFEPCLKVGFADGTRDTRLRFAGAELRPGEPPELRLALRDEHYPLALTLVYRLHEQNDLVERHAILCNTGAAPILVERAFSAQWQLPLGKHYRLSHMCGRWSDEGQLRREPLPSGTTILESRRISSSHHHSPWFMLDDGTAQQEQGLVFFGALAWSGNWKLCCELSGQGTTRASIGLNDWDFAYRLEPGESLATPACVGGLSAGGFGGASRLLHAYLRDRLLRERREPRALIYNSWEATLFDIDVESQGRLAEHAAALGCEIFVVDDGWFHRRDSDRAALGDWWPDARNFPKGLTPLIDRVNALGMAFGIWIEPEMVSPDSELYRAHPDWIIRFPGRPPTEARNQLMLNLARPDVQDHLIATFDHLLAEHDIRYVKWDMNRNVSEPGWPEAPGDARELWVRYVWGVYRVWGELRARHPRVTWLSCSGGGGRADLGILGLADRVQISDNTDATAILKIQESFAQLLPAPVLESWVADTNAERLPLAFRFHAAMAGALVIGGHLARWSEAQRAEATELIAQYKAVRAIVHGGERYQLRSAHDSPFPAILFVSEDRAEAVLFAFRVYAPDPAEMPALALHGLDPEACYAVEGSAARRSGLSWMHAGLSLSLGNFESAMLRIKRV